MYECLGERRIKKQRREYINTLQWQYAKHWVASPDGQSAQNLRSSSGYDWRITSWAEGSRETRCTLSTGQGVDSHTTSSRRSASQRRATGKFVARTRATIWEIVTRPEVIQTVLRSRFEICRNWTIFPCSSATKRKRNSIFMPRIHDALRSRRNSCKRVDLKQCALWPSLGRKFAITTEDTVLKFKFNLCFKIEPYLGLELWTVSTNLSEKPCRSTRKSKLQVNPLQSETNMKTVTNKWFGLYWSSPLWPSCWWMQEKAIRPYWMLVRRDEEELRQCTASVDRAEEKVSILLESELPSSILVPSSNPRTFRKYNHSCIARHWIVTRKFHRVYFSRRKRKKLRSIVDHGFIPGGVSPKTGRQAVFSLLWIRWIIKMT